MKQRGLFDEEDRLRRLSELGDSLERLNKYINWEDFRGILTKNLTKEAAGPGGRPAYDYVMMFKILILQKMYNISDDQTEYQINDRLSFQRFLGLALNDKAPDAKTIWHFREEITKAEITETIFYRFVRRLEERGVITWTLPRWATKNREVHYGYKNHIKADKKSKIITKFQTSEASEHDSQELKNLIEVKKDKRIYADSAYTGEAVPGCMPKEIKNRIHEKGYRNRPLSKTQERNNRAKSKIRARVEHIFGHMSNSMRELFIRSIGKIRAHIQIGLINLADNLSRYSYLRVQQAQG